MPKVSIIVPVYNVERYLSECLDSIRSQTMQDWEAILVDDGSTDSSGIVCDDYAAKDSRFRVLHKENGGAASAKNVGLDHVTGEYTAFLDSDDTVSSVWLETCMALCSEADVIEYAFDKHYVSCYERVAFAEETGSFTAESYLSQYLDNWQCSLFWNKIFNSELLRTVRFRKERRCIDDEFFTYKAVSYADVIIRIPDVLYHYRQRQSGAVTSEKNKKQITDDALEILIERYQWVCRKFPGLRRIFLQHDVDIMFYFAREFIFSEETIQKFRKTARYYLFQSLMHFSGRITLQYALILLTLKSKSFRKDYKVSSISNNLFP